MLRQGGRATSHGQEHPRKARIIQRQVKKRHSTKDKRKRENVCNGTNSNEVMSDCVYKKTRDESLQTTQRAANVGCSGLADRALKGNQWYRQLGRD